MAQLDAVFVPLDTRVQQEGAAAKAEELRKKKEREEAGRRMKEERLRRLEEERIAASSQEQSNALAVLPNQIESPLKPSVGLAAAAATSPGTLPVRVNSSLSGSQQRDFSDLVSQRSDQGAIDLAESQVSRQPTLGMPPRPPGEGPSISELTKEVMDTTSISCTGGLARQSPGGSLSGLPAAAAGGLSQQHPSLAEARRSGNGSFNRVAPEPLPVGNSL